MPKFISVVKFVVKEGEVENFTASMKKFVNPDGVIFRKVIKTGDRSYCSVVEWIDEDSLAKARQQMIAYLDTVRDLLEEITPELGVTDPASGPVIIDEQGLVTSPGGTISGIINTSNKNQKITFNQ